MRLFHKIMTVGLLMMVVLVLCVSADNTYTSSTDPLISLSYADDVLAPRIMEQVMARVSAEYVKAEDVHKTSDVTYRKLDLLKGQTIMADGVLEVVSESGSMLVVITSAANIKDGIGITDATAGTVLTSGASVPNHHYLVAAKGDGRGIVVTSDSASLLVRGEYHITG